MDYKEKYEQALERARNIRFGNPQSATANTVCEEIFPELKESEDERIRKAILALVTQSGHILSPMNQKSMIGWLKKQGEQKSSWSEEDCAYMTLIGEILDYEHRRGKFTTNDIKFFNNGIITVEQIQDWLKSLREKMKVE